MVDLIVRLQDGELSYVSAEFADREVSRLTKHKTHRVRMYWTAGSVLVDVIRSFNDRRVLSYYLDMEDGK
ncbi:hypothetical protein RGQ21_67230 [Kitasatospora aureofaciens]|nr:hypothetical protein RGQ21_67230 [Kitasatospora aureofaciens]